MLFRSTFQSKDKPIFVINNPVVYFSSGGGWENQNGFNETGNSSPIINLSNENGNKNENGFSEDPDLSGYGKENKGFISKITGAVVGAVTSNPRMTVIIFVLGLLGTFISVRTIRKRKEIS